MIIAAIVSAALMLTAVAVAVAVRKGARLEVRASVSFQPPKPPQEAQEPSPGSPKVTVAGSAS